MTMNFQKYSQPMPRQQGFGWLLWFYMWITPAVLNLWNENESKLLKLWGQFCPPWPRHNSSEKPQVLQGILWSLSLFRKERQHVNPSEGDLNMTLRCAILRPQRGVLPPCAGSEWAGAGLQPHVCLRMLGAEGQCLDNLAKVRMLFHAPEAVEKQGVIILFFSELILEDHRQGLLPCASD